ncbi:stereocilin [Ramlibacter sp. PS4R-6]
MATHPVEPEPAAPDSEPSAPNPSHLPVEPEFAPTLPPDADDPHAKPPTL